MTSSAAIASAVAPRGAHGRSPGGQLARAARDQRRGCTTRRDGPAKPSRREKSSSAARAPERRRVLRDDGEPGLDDVGERDVVEADVRDRALEPEVVDGADGLDGDEVLAREERGRRVLGEQQLARDRVRRVVGVADERGLLADAVARERVAIAPQALGGRVQLGAVAQKRDAAVAVLDEVRDRGAAPPALSVRTTSASTKLAGRSTKTSATPAARSRCR